MKTINIGKIIGTILLGLMIIVSSNQMTEAHGNKNERKQQKRIDKQQRKEWQNRSKLEDRRIRADQRNESTRLRNLPYLSPANDDRWRSNRNGVYYNTNGRGVEMLRQAVRAGYQEGYRAGRDDRNYRRSDSYQSSAVYRRANFGYRNYVNAAEYRYYFQEGFQRGYEDGYQSRYQYGSNDQGSLNILGSILGAILNVERY